MHGLQNLFNEICFSTSSHPRDHTTKRVLQSTIQNIYVFLIIIQIERNFFLSEGILYFSALYLKRYFSVVWLLKKKTYV